MKDVLRRHPFAAFSLSGVAVLAFLAWAILVLGRPLPPRSVVMTTGPEGGAYRELGERYRAALRKNGIDLKLVPSLGNVENLRRLEDTSSSVSAGFVSGGLTTAAASPGIVSLGTISYDPIWIFCRGMPEPVTLADFRGKRVSIGPEGGGTRVAMLELLRANEMENAITPLPLSPGPGGEALLRGEIDCACMLTASDAPIVKKLLADESVRLVASPRADAYVALYPHLKKLTVFRGVGSLSKDLPREDVTILATMSSLLVREDLHPAIQFLLLEAASEIHSGPGIFRRPGQFPAAEPVDVPLSKEARTYYKSGGTFLQRHLPFWLGVLAQRILLVLLPLAGLLYPLVRLVPASITFAVELRLRALYAELRRIEGRIKAGAPGAARDLAALEERVAATKVPRSGARSLYTLKQHIALVRERLEGADRRPPASSTS
ncbi:MAG TPA: TAXI family TRAP transporter solute-binding subunit [Thermoanaerobaculia bacterium]|nr:TAXI family TRAP transporter solute-binding subunit [Thermoanaerobaculia bacterium]HQR67081.1 TAXI family TRAP transporter solute-binding subunit [Thermoanaerobaculia bacterium]